MRKIATVICARCYVSKKQYGIRTEKIDAHWYFTWAFPLKKSVADHEKYSETVINESPSQTESFNGCPFCKTKNFIYCGGCGKLNCYNGDEKFVCQWCNMSGTVSNSDWGSLLGGGF